MKRAASAAALLMRGPDAGPRRRTRGRAVEQQCGEPRRLDRPPVASGEVPRAAALSCLADRSTRPPRRRTAGDSSLSLEDASGPSPGKQTWRSVPRVRATAVRTWRRRRARLSGSATPRPRRLRSPHRLGRSRPPAGLGGARWEARAVRWSTRAVAAASSARRCDRLRRWTLLEVARSVDQPRRSSRERTEPRRRRRVGPATFSACQCADVHAPPAPCPIRRSPGAPPSTSAGPSAGVGVTRSSEVR